jgi:hypothetical protein
MIFDLFELENGTGFKLASTKEYHANAGYIISKNSDTMTVRLFWPAGYSHIIIISRFTETKITLMSDEETIELKLSHI